MSSTIPLLEHFLRYKEVITDHFLPWMLLLDKLKQIKSTICYKDLLSSKEDDVDKMVKEAFDDHILKTCFSDTATKGRQVCSDYAVENFF
jgi:hypothetical protein